MPVPQSKTVILSGGLDLVSPALAVKPEDAIGLNNYECQVRGYQSLTGYERFDGRAKPSEAQYWILDFDAGSTAISAGDTVTGASSGETGVALVDAVLESGSYAGGDAAGYLVLHSVGSTGFTDNENLQVSAATRAVANGSERLNDADTEALDQTYREAEVSRRRALITTVPGSGAVRGVVTYDGDTYAFRDNAGATACVMHKATAAGWVAQTFGELLPYGSGSAEFLEGETVTGTTSTATATIDRVILADGAWGGSAEGWLVISGVTGTFGASETITSASGSATTTGVSAAITLPAGGHYIFEIHNFYGSALTPNLYLANGEGPAHEWTGSVLSPIYTGLDSVYEKPGHVAAYKSHLFLGYPSGLVQHSSIGEPLEFDTTRLAGSLSFGRRVTGLLGSAQSTLVVFGERKVGYFTGTPGATDFDLKELTDEAGCREFTAQMMEKPVYVDERGIRDLAATEALGGFLAGTLSRNIEPLVRAKRDGKTPPSASIRVRSKDQYRVFFTDGSGVIMYSGLGQKPRFSTFSLPVTMFCAHSDDDTNGNEILLTGGSDGYVYQLDKGTSFDGEAIETLIRLPFYSYGAPDVDKQFRKVILELEAAVSATVEVAVEYSYGSTRLPSTTSESFAVRGSGGYWDEAFWDAFFWDEDFQSVLNAHIEGIGINASVSIRSSSATSQTHTLSALTMQYWPRRRIR